MGDSEASVAVKTPENKEKQMLKKSTWGDFKAEAKQINMIFTPMLIVTTSQYMLRFVSTLMIGHVGKLQLSGAVVSMSFTNVTGFSFLVSFYFFSSFLKI